MKKINILIIIIFFLIPKVSLASVIQPYTNYFYVNDFANVLSDETISHIINRNAYLSEYSNAQIVLTTVVSTNNIDPGAYAREMFNRWGIGSGTENNGILILFIIQEEYYEIILGDGLLHIIPPNEINRIFLNYVEPFFEAGNFDSAARIAFDQIFSILQNHYTNNQINTISPLVDAYDNVIVTGQGEGGRQNINTTVFSVIMILAFILIFLRIFGSSSRRRFNNVKHRGSMEVSSIFWWFMPKSSSRKKSTTRQRGTNATTEHPQSRRYKGHSTSFGGSNTSGNRRNVSRNSRDSNNEGGKRR